MEDVSQERNLLQYRIAPAVPVSVSLNLLFLNLKRLSLNPSLTSVNSAFVVWTQSYAGSRKNSTNVRASSGPSSRHVVGAWSRSFSSPQQPLKLHLLSYWGKFHLAIDIRLPKSKILFSLYLRTNGNLKGNVYMSGSFTPPLPPRMGVMAMWPLQFTQGPRLQRHRLFASCSAAAIRKFLIIFEQRVLVFIFHRVPQSM